MTGKSEMNEGGKLIQSGQDKIRYFWEWLNLNKEKLKEYKPDKYFDSLYKHLENISENLKGDSHIAKESFIYQMLKSIVSSLCEIAPIPIIMYSDNTKFYELGVLRGKSGEVLSVMLEYNVNVEGNKATLADVYEISECFEPIDADIIENVLMWTGFRHVAVLNIEIPGVHKKIRVEFNESKIEIKKIE
jgi:hypothetical protein